MKRGRPEHDPTPEATREAVAWLRSQPASVQAAVMSYPPGIYRLKGREVLLHAYTTSDRGRVCDLCIVLHRCDNPACPAWHREECHVLLADLVPVDVPRWLVDGMKQ